MAVFTGDEGEVISLDDGRSFTSNYRTANPGAIKAHTVGKNRLNSILNQTGCVGVKMYYGLDEEDAKCLVLVGVKEDGSDMTGGVIVERNPPCPPYCDDQSALNS